MLRHARVFTEAWVSETKRRKNTKNLPDHTDFLPAALEVIETPPSPIGRIIIWLIILAAITALLWASIAKVDEVAVAEGRLVPSGRLRSVEASEQGVIRAINVREGQHVNAGDVLIELDPTEASADAQSAAIDLSTAALTRARDNALLSYGEGKGSTFAPPKGASASAIAAEKALVSARIEEYQAKVQSIDERRRGADDAVASTQAEIDKLQQTLPLLKEQYESEKELSNEGYGARQKLLQTQQAYISAQQDFNGQKAHLQEAKAQADSLRSDEAQTKEAFLGTAAQERAEAEGSVAERSQALTKADDKKAHMRLVAPVSGTIQEVTVTTIGQTPEVGKPLVTMVADGEELVAEGLLLNRDAGFVHEGENVTIKLDAYPFTRYGILQGVVEHVSPDATVDEHRGLVFPIRVKLAGRFLRVDGRPAALSAGMSTTLEVVTGKRRVIGYFWSPLVKGFREAARER